MTRVKPTSKGKNRILVITGEDLRHQYFVKRLNAQFPLVGVLTESAAYPEPEAHSLEEKNAWDWFFTRRKKYETLEFNSEHCAPSLNDPPTTKIPHGKLNAPETLKIIQSLCPGFIAIFGTGLLGPQIMDFYPRQIFNLHVGLPQYYRGSSCNFWPIHNGCPEKLGASVHLANPGIDTGEIAAQSKIEFHEDDDEQTLAGKTFSTGIELMVSTIQHWRNETLNFTSPDKIGKLYLRKDFTPGAVLRVRQMVESGELKRQLTTRQ